MKTSVTVDEVGRLVLPKNLRAAIGVFGRMAVTVEVVGHVASITVPDAAARQRGAQARTIGLCRTVAGQLG